MVSRQSLIKKLGKEYEDMLNQINIADFTKCIAQFSGLDLKDVADSAIEEYLTYWAKHKLVFFKMLGNKVKIDIPLEYINYGEDSEEKFNAFQELEKKYISYAGWLKGFEELDTNKISERDVSMDACDLIATLFPRLNIDGVTLTHFFKSFLNAPDELVTDIGRIFETDKIKGKYTISIDPVDMMLASENPYGWDSCYGLTLSNPDSHADGCLAAIIDTSSLITYLWNREGEFRLENDYVLKNVRYKRMRAWLSICPDLAHFHFNLIYPNRVTYPNEFQKQLREIIENVISNYTHNNDCWARSFCCDCYRELPHGYSEYMSDRIYTQDNETVRWSVFDVPIVCPCGCGDYLPGSQEDDWVPDGDQYHKYNGDGFIRENFYIENEYYCDSADCYCSHEYGDYECQWCAYWKDEHPVCSLTKDDEICENFRDLELEVDDGVAMCEEEKCKNCPLYKYEKRSN